MADFDPFESGAVAVDEPPRQTDFDPFEQGGAIEPIGAGRQALGRFAQGVASGVAGLPEAIAIGGAALARKFGDPLLSKEEESDVAGRPLYKAGRAIRASIAKDFPVDETRPRTFWGDTIPQGAGNLATFFLGGLGGKALRFAGPATTVALGAGTGGAEAYDEAIKAGASDEDAFKVFAINAGLGTTEAIPIGGWLNRLNKASGNKLKRAIIEGSEEAAQEVFQQVGGNLTAQKYYDPDRKIFEGAGEGGAAGFTLGSVMSLVVSAIGGRRARLPSEEEPSAPGRARRALRLPQTPSEQSDQEKLAAQTITIEQPQEDSNAKTRVKAPMAVGEEKQTGLVSTIPAGTSGEIQKPSAVPTQAQPVEAEVASQVTLASVLAMTPAQYFDVSAQWSAESMSEAGGISPQIRAELAAKANPDLKAWQDAQAKASADFAALRAAATADPNMMGNPDFQKQFSGAAQRASFFSEGRAVLDRTKEFDPRTVALSPEPTSGKNAPKETGAALGALTPPVSGNTPAPLPGAPIPVSGEQPPVPTPGVPAFISGGAAPQPAVIEGDIFDGTPTVLTDEGKLISGTDHGDAKNRAEERGYTVSKPLGEVSGWFKNGKNYLAKDYEGKPVPQSVLSERKPEVLADYPDLKPTQPETKPAAPVETVRQENLRKQALAEVERQIAASAGEKSVGSFVADVKDSTGSWMKETVSVLSISDPVKLSRPSSDGGWQVSFEAPSTLGKTGRQTRTRNFFKKADALVWIDEVKRGKPAPAPASDVSPKQPRQPTTLQQLDELVIQHGLETGRIDDLETLHAPKITETSSLGSMGLAAKRKYSEQIKTARERIASDLGIAKDNLETSEGRTELLAKLKERIESTSKLVEVALSDMPEGSDFTVHGEKFTVKDTNEETGIVTLKDGRTLKVNERASVKIDPGSLQAKEATFDPEAENPVVSKGGELGGEIGQTFNLVGEKTKFVEPTKETTAFGDETLSQNDLFQIEQVTKEVDPFKSADAAQKMYGGAAEAAAIVERQLRTLDQNPEFKKQFDKKQRARLTEVLNLLRERATAAPEANIAERAIAGGESGSQIPFRDIGPGHAKFDDGLKLLVEARSLTDERAEILRDLFRGTDDGYLGRFTIEPRTMRAVGWARWHGKEGENRKAWLKLKRGLADLTDTSKEGFWAEPSHEPIVVFAHEYAHVAEYLLLTDADRALVKETFQRLKANGRIIEFFSEGMAGSEASAKYYAKNWKEFLSESFAEYMMSKKVPTESMRPILARLYDAFKVAIARVFQRGAKGETAMLEPLYEKMLRGGEISPDLPTGEGMASGGAPIEPTGSTVDPATGERIPNAEGDAQVVQIAGIEYNIIAKERLTAEQKAAADTRARDFFGKELNLPGEPDLSYGKQRGAIDTNIVFKVESDGENHDDAGEALLKHLTEQIQSQHQPGGNPAYVSSLVNAINKNFNVGNFNGVFSDGMIQRLMEISVGESSWRGTMLRAVTGINEDMGTVARNAKFFLRRTYENMFGGDLARKVMDRIALNFRERFTGEEIERLYNENPILQELFLKVISRLNVKPSLREVIQEIFATRIDRQDDIVEKFVDTMVNKFSATPSEAVRLKAEFSRTFEQSFATARTKAQEKALAALLPEERKTIGAQTPLWKKLTDLVNSGWFDSAVVVEEYARSKGMIVPTEAELERMRNWSIKEQSLREPTARDIANNGGDAEKAAGRVASATLEARQDLLRKMNTQWSRWTHPLIRSLRDISDPIKRYNTAMAANEWLTANLLLKLGFGTRQIIDVGTQMVLHTPTRAAQYAFEQWSNDRSAGRDANLFHNLSQSITDAYRTRLKVLGDTLASFRRTLAGKGEQKNVEQLLSSIAVFDRALLRADEMKAEGKPAAARFLTLLALTMRFGRQFAAAADIIQGVPAEAQEMAHQIRTGLREQGKPKFQQEFEFNTILGLLTTARAESLSEARQMLEARGLEVSNAAVQRAAWHILREKIYNMAKTAGLPADEWKAQNHYYRNVIGWNEPESQGLGAIGGPGGAVAMTAKIGKELFSKAGVPAFPFVFGNAMGISLNRKLAYTPLGLFPGFFKGSPWFEGERNIRQRKIEAVIGTTIGSTLFTLAALGIWVVLPRKWPDDEKEKAEWTANGWQPGMLIIPVSDTQEMKIGTRVGPMALLSPYLAAGGALHDATVQQAKKQEVLNERAAKLGLTPEKLEGLDAGQWLNVIGSAAWASAAGGRTASGMLGSYTDFGKFSPKKSGASATSTLIPGLPGYQEVARMAGANINPKLASFWDLLVPLPTSDANRVNMLGDPMRNENDFERIFQVLSGGTAPLPANSEAFKKNKAYTSLFESDFRPPAINPVRGYQFGDELRPMTEPELQRYTTARGKHFSQELQSVDVSGLTPKAAKAIVQSAFYRANAAALNEVGASSPSRSSASAPVISLPADSPLPRSPRASTGRARAAVGRLPVTRVSSGRARSRIRLASMKLPRLSTGRARRGVRTRIGRVTGRARSRVTRSFRPPRTRRPRFAFQMI